MKNMKKITLAALIASTFGLNAAVTESSAPGSAIGGDSGAATNIGCTDDSVDAAGDVTDTVTFAAVGNITDANVDVDITHTWRGDLRIDIDYNAVKTYMVTVAHGGNVDNYFASFDDQGALVCNDASQCAGGAGTCDTAGTRSTCQPDNALTGYNGMASNLGAWTLSVCDTANGDWGSLDRWSVTLQGQPGDGLPVELMNLDID